ncbi:MAG: 2-hydroxyglutaryl-CoA dehydratase [Deltaproteobacteria bacterium]|nr:2-hydroxyglutaryl-CoA dehydratase [Deltaproteobacteria bacterium]
MIVAGIDIGSSTAKAVIIKDHSVLSTAIIPTGSNSADTAMKVMDRALTPMGLSLNDMAYIVSTGYGRIKVPFTKKNITEISCHARGISSVFPTVRTILDMGGQDCKAIQCDGNGKVQNFVMNDKCAAGTGRYLERISKTLDVAIEDIGDLSLLTKEGPATISSFCAVFAQGDVITLLRKGTYVNDILAGVCEALTERIQRLIKQVGMTKDFAISGGIAKNKGVVSRLERNLEVKAHIAPEPQIIGALGAALFAEELAGK